MNYFEKLNSINVNDKIEKKNGLTYLSWAYAWGELKKKYPNSYYTVYENEKGWNYFTDGLTCWVKTGVTINSEDTKDLEHIEYLPIMDFKNKSIPADKVTSFDVNKAIQRSLTKAVARHGLGLYIYAGEDLPEAPTTADNVLEVFKGKQLAPTLEEMIDKCESSEELGNIYNSHKKEICMTPGLLNKITEKGKRLTGVA